MVGGGEIGTHFWDTQGGGGREIGTRLWDSQGCGGGGDINTSAYTQGGS